MRQPGSKMLVPHRDRCDLAESLASEHASRLAAMQHADRNIQERLEELRAQFRQQRQLAITTELLDIVAGFEALADQRSWERS